MIKQIRQWNKRRTVRKAVGSFDAKGLVRAVESADEPSVTALLENGISADTLNTQQSPVLHLAVQAEHIAIIRVLLDAFANPDLSDEHGRTALMIAARAGSVKIVGLLLDKGADPNGTSQNGETALMCTQSVTIVQQLIDKGANCDQIDEQGKTALMHAIINGYTGVVKKLLNEGADPNIRDVENHTALDQEGLSPGLIKLLRDKGGKTGAELAASEASQSETPVLNGITNSVMEQVSLPADLLDWKQWEQKLFSGNDASHNIEEFVKWVLEVMVELKRIGVSIQDIAAVTETKDINSIRKIQNQISVGLKGFADYMEMVAREKCAIDVLAPASVAGHGESQLIRWLVKDNQTVAAAEPICELMQGEQVRSIYAEKAGRLIHKAWKNDRVIAGSVIGRIEPLPPQATPDPSPVNPSVKS